MGVSRESRESVRWELIFILMDGNLINSTRGQGMAAAQCIANQFQFYSFFLSFEEILRNLAALSSPYFIVNTLSPSLMLSSVIRLSLHILCSWMEEKKIMWFFPLHSRSLDIQLFSFSLLQLTWLVCRNLFLFFEFLLLISLLAFDRGAKTELSKNFVFGTMGQRPRLARGLIACHWWGGEPRAPQRKDD